MTATVFVPDCFRTVSCTAFSPFRRDMPRASTTPSSA
jgi:hypothetical protein